MRGHLPSSCANFRVRFSLFDTFWAALSPLLALWIRGAYILSPKGVNLVILYCLISFVFSMIAIMAFRLNDGISRYFSVHDAIKVVQAVCTAGLMTALFLFTFTRLEGIPRSTPLIHVLILASGLITVRAFALLRETDGNPTTRAKTSALEHIILIGANDLTAFYIKFIRAYSPIYYRIVGVLDDTPHLFGRTVAGVPVMAPVHYIERIIDEFHVHGVRTDHIVIGGDETFLSEEALAEVRRVCTQREIGMKFVSDLIGLGAHKASNAAREVDVNYRPSHVSVPAYHRTKRVIDFIVSAMAILLLAPLIIVVSVMILFDVGSPVIFWQQRVSQGGGTFFLYKFRTLQAPFDAQGRLLADAQRLSFLGRFLRKTRFDELPQLFNVLVGNMSLIGPRPLLPRDQPTNTKLRLAARPGITGWAQINGGNLITNDEKGALDDWYVRNASPWLDLRIVGLTFLFLFRGERRSEPALNQAITELQKSTQTWHAAAHARRNAREELGPVLQRGKLIRVRSGNNDRSQIVLRRDQSDRNQDL